MYFIEVYISPDSDSDSYRGWCHCSVLWFGGRVTTPLQCAIVVCDGWGEGEDHLWRSGRGAIAGCHCSVLWLRTNLEEWTWCHCWVPL